MVEIQASSRDITERKESQVALQRAHQGLQEAYDKTIEGWVLALDLRDRETEGHTQRVTEMTVRLARELGHTEEEIVHIRRGALLHDMGKMGIPDEILQKPGPLTDDEWVVMRKHPQYAYQMLSPISYLNQALIIPYYHHERWDGSGYPHGLKGEQIPLFRAHVCSSGCMGRAFQRPSLSKANAPQGSGRISGEGSRAII